MESYQVGRKVIVLSGIHADKKAVIIAVDGEGDNDLVQVRFDSALNVGYEPKYFKRDLRLNNDRQ